MNLITETKQYFLNCSSSSSSIQKNNSTFNSDITYYIPKFITNDKNILYYSAKISHCEIPYSFYIINSNNNKLIINNITYVIDEGNYNAYTLLEKINLLLPDDFTLNFNEENGKYNLLCDVFFTISSLSTINKIIGLDNYNYSGLFDFSTNKYNLIFPYLVNVSGSKNIYIETNLITNNLNLNSNSVNVLKSVPVDVPPYGIILYNNNENIETIIKNRELNYLEIKLKDDDNQLINFNNISWSITLEIKITKQLTYNNFTLNDFFNNNNIENLNNSENK